MRLSISNIAWDPSEDDVVARLLQRFAIDAIDVAPGKYFSNFAEVTDAEIDKVKRWWRSRGIAITGMQALLFGTIGLNMFGAENIRRLMLSHLGAVCRIGGGLGASRLVFGSPKNRDRSGLSDEDTFEQAVSFFQQLGDIAQRNGVVVCLEPNPSCYGSNFMMNSSETALVVRAVSHSSIRMQFDTGSSTINGELPDSVLEQSKELIGHIHLSEPNLLPLGDGGTDHRLMHKAISSVFDDQVLTIEMLATKQEPHLSSIERALIHAVSCYRSA